MAMAREASQLAGQEVGLLGDLPGPKLRIDEVEGGVVELQAGSELTLTTGEEIGDAGQLPVSWEGLPAAVSEGDEVYLADGRVRLRVLGATSGEVRCAVEVGGRGRLAPGAEHARDRGAPAVRRPHRPRLGGLRGRAGHRPARGVLRPPRRGPGARRAPRPGRRSRHPADRQDREAAGGRERRGDHSGGAERDHGGPRRPRDRDRDRAGAGGPEAAAGAGRAPLPAVDHRDPDARLDGGVAPAHPSGGLGRGRRDLPGNGRRDAVGGDGGRRVSRWRPCG